MRILLLNLSIFNTIDKLDDELFNELINKIIYLADIEMDQMIVISFNDSTKNKDIILFYIRKLFDKLNNNEIKLGYQFLGDRYFKRINDLSLLYENNKTKEDRIINYINKIIENDNFVNLYYIDGNEISHDKFKKVEEDSNITIINESNEEILIKLDEIINNKIKKIRKY